MTEDSGNVGDKDSSIDRSTQYLATNDRRSKNFEFYWQAVALSLTAQAFLMSVALGGSTSQSGRVLAALLSLFASFAALSLMSSQWSYQKIEALWLDFFEQGGKFTRMIHEGRRSVRLDAVKMAYKDAGIPFVDPKKPHLIPRNREDLRDVRFDATAMWSYLMWAFIITDILVLLFTIVNHNSLSSEHFRTHWTHRSL